MLCLCCYSHLVRRHSGFLMACVKMWRIVGAIATHTLTPTQSMSYVQNILFGEYIHITVSSGWLVR